MGVRLAKEIWEAEQCFGDSYIYGDDTMREGEEVKLMTQGSIVSEDVMDGIAQDDNDTSMLADMYVQDQRERIAEECIRELEDMEVDVDAEQEHDDMDGKEVEMIQEETISSTMDSMDEDHEGRQTTVMPEVGVPSDAAPVNETPLNEMLIQEDTSNTAMDVDVVTTPSSVPTPLTPTNTSSRTPALFSHSQRRLSFPWRVQVRVDLEVGIFSKTASNSNSGCGVGPRRRSLVDDKLSMVTAAKKWFEKSAL